jgi:hypothetical protein
MHVLDPYLDAGGYPGDGLHRAGLTGRHATDWVIKCSIICNRNLVCGEGTRLNCCDVITTTGDYDMAIITLDRLYFVLSYRLTPTDIVYVPYG